MKKSLHLVLTLAVTMALSSCYGPFNLTRKFYKWEGGVSNNKWAVEGVYLLTSIGYVFTAMGDALIFNSIEFWGGKNPVTAKNIKSIQKGDDQAVLSYSPEQHRLRIDSFKNGQVVSTVILEPGTDGHMVAHNAQGEVLMTAKMEDGMVTVTDASGKQVGRYDPAKAQELLSKTN